MITPAARACRLFLYRLRCLFFEPSYHRNATAPPGRPSQDDHFIFQWGAVGEGLNKCFEHDCFFFFVLRLCKKFSGIVPYFSSVLWLIVHEFLFQFFCCARIFFCIYPPPPLKIQKGLVTGVFLSAYISFLGTQILHRLHSLSGFIAAVW